MSKVWIATAADIEQDGSWAQIVTYDAADVLRFLLQYPSAHVAQWELPDPSGGGITTGTHITP